MTYRRLPVSRWLSGVSFQSIDKVEYRHVGKPSEERLGSSSQKSLPSIYLTDRGDPFPGQAYRYGR